MIWPEMKLPKSMSIFITKPYINLAMSTLRAESVRSRGKVKVRKYAPCLSEHGEILLQQLPWGPIDVQDESASGCA